MLKKNLCEKKIYTNLSNLIIDVIKIDDDLYNFQLQKKFEKIKFKKIKFLKEIHIKNREKKFISKRFHDDEIMSMKLNFVKLFKEKKFKKNIQKKSKKCYIYEKIKHFVKNNKSTNMMNQFQLNILQTIFVKKEFKKMCDDEIIIF